MSMRRFTVVLGAVLIVLGLGAYFGTGRQSVTALIPSAFGVVLAALGVVAQHPRLHKHAMHAALVVALLGVAGTVRGLLQLPALISDPEPFERPAAIVVQAVMCVLCVVFVVSGIVSFVRARRGAPAEG